MPAGNSTAVDPGKSTAAVQWYILLACFSMNIATGIMVGHAGPKPAAQIFRDKFYVWMDPCLDPSIRCLTEILNQFTPFHPPSQLSVSLHYTVMHVIHLVPSFC